MNEAWNKYKETGNITTDEDLIKMMQNLIDAKNLLDMIGGNYYDVVTFRLLMEWQSLKYMAQARNLKYPQWETPKTAN